VTDVQPQQDTLLQEAVKAGWTTDEDLAMQALKGYGIDKLGENTQNQVLAWEAKKETKPITALQPEAISRKFSGGVRGGGSMVTGIRDLEDTLDAVRVRRTEAQITKYQQTGNPADRPSDEDLKWYADIQNFANKKRTAGAKTIGIMLDSWVYAQDFFIGGGTLKLFGVKALEEAAAKAGEKGIIHELLVNAGRGAAMVTVADAEKEALALAGAPTASRFRVNFQNELRMMQSTWGLDDEEGGDLLTAMFSGRDEVVRSLYRAGLQQLIEGGSETLGGTLAKMPIAKRIAALQHMAVGRLLGQGASVPEALQKVASGAAYDGMFQEWLEQRAGDFASAAAGLITWEQAIPTLSDTAAELVAFGAPGLGGVLAGRVIGKQVQPTESQIALAKDVSKGSPRLQRQVEQYLMEVGAPGEAPPAQVPAGAGQAAPGAAPGEESLPEVPPAPEGLLERVRSIPELKGVSEVGTAQTREEAALQAREVRAGRKVWFGDLPENVGGVTLPGGDILLRRGPARTMEGYAAHESIHAAAMAEPEAASRILRALERHLPEQMSQARESWAQRYEEAFGKPAPAELGQEEAAAVLAESLPRVLPKIADNPEALQDLLRDRGFLQRVLDALADVARRVGLKIDGPTLKRLRAALEPDVPRGTSAAAVREMADLATFLARIRKLPEGEARRVPEGEGGGQYLAAAPRYAPKEEPEGRPVPLGLADYNMLSSIVGEEADLIQNVLAKRGPSVDWQRVPLTGSEELRIRKAIEPIAADTAHKYHRTAVSLLERLGQAYSTSYADTLDFRHDRELLSEVLRDLNSRGRIVGNRVVFPDRTSAKQAAREYNQRLRFKREDIEGREEGTYGGFIFPSQDIRPVTGLDIPDELPPRFAPISDEDRARRSIREATPEDLATLQETLASTPPEGWAQAVRDWAGLEPGEMPVSEAEAALEAARANYTVTEGEPQRLPSGATRRTVRLETPEGAYMEASLSEDTIYVEDVEVPENLRRQGIARAMYQELAARFPGRRFGPSAYRTEAGAGLRQAIEQDLPRFAPAAWHGSAADFDEFRDEKIGSGEGAQAYGHYFAGKREVAEWYREQAAGTPTIGGVSAYAVHREAMDRYKEANARVGEALHANDENAMLEAHRQSVQHVADAVAARLVASHRTPNVERFSADLIRREIDRLGGYGMAGSAPTVEDVRRALSGMDVKAGRLYKVDLAPAEDEYLLWDEPLSAQSEKVKAALEPVLAEAERLALESGGAHAEQNAASVRDKDWKAGDLYNAVLSSKRVFGSDRAASQALLSAGIRGIKYRDATSRGKEGEGSYNYVVFDPKDIKIEERFAPAPPRDSEAFKRWFGDSKVVDENGEPLVVYHSTHAGFTVPDPSRAIGSLGFHVGTAEQAQATQDTGGTASDVNARRPEMGQRIMPLFARIRNPLRMKDKGTWYSFDLVDRLAYVGIRDMAPLPDNARELAGYDAPHMSITWGNFSEARKRYEVARRRRLLAYMDAHPEASRDMVQDEKLRLGNAYVRELIESAGYDGIVYDNVYEGGGDSWIAFHPSQIKSATGNRGTYDPENPDIRFAPRPVSLKPLEPATYEAVELPPVAARSLDAARRKIQDFALPIQRWEEAIQKAGGYTEKSVRDVIANMPGRVQGRHEELQAHLKDIFRIGRREKWWGMGQDAALSMLGDAVSAEEVMDRNRILEERGVVNGGGMTNAEAQRILDESLDRPGVKEIVAIAREVMESTRNQMADTGLVSQERLEQWRRDQPNYVPLRTAETDAEGPAWVGPRGRGFQVTRPVVMEMRGRRSRADNPLVFLFAQAQSMNIAAEKNRVGQRMWEVMRHPDNVGLVSFTELEPPADISEWKPADAFTIYTEGERRTIKLSSPDVNRAMKGLGFAPAPPWLQMHARVLRLMGGLITRWNPEFMFRNFFRDLGTAGVNIGVDQQRAIRLRVLRTMPAAMRAIGARELFGKAADTELGRYYDEVYRKEGGLIGWSKDVTYEELHKDMLREIERGFASRTFSGIANALAAMNSVIEQGVRVAAAYELEKGGLPREKAIRAARELTVDFNRRGEASSALGAYKLFANARIQGAAQMLVNMKRQPKIAALGAGIAAFAFGQAIANFYAMGDDDDDENIYLKKPDWERDGHMMFPNPFSDDKRDMFKVPLAYGYNVFWVLGDRAAEAMLRKMHYNEDSAVGDAVNRVARALWDGFSPVSESSLAQMLAPSGLVPFVQIAENRDWKGDVIMPDGNPFDPAPPPDSERAWKSISPVAQETARFINRMFGGNRFRAGTFLGMDASISPESIEHVFDSYLGGVGKVFTNTAKLAGDPWADTGWSKVPVMRSFYSTGAVWQDRGTFYENIEEVHRANKEVAGLGDKAPARSKREAALYGQAKQAAKDAKKLRERHEAAGSPEERQRLEEEMRALYLRFNRAFNETRR